MKKIMTLIAISLMASTAFAQTEKPTAKDLAKQQKELAKQQKDLSEITMKMFNAKPTKEAKKQAKEYTKQGWVVNPGDKALEKQITYGELLGEELMVDDEGNTSKRFIQQLGRSTAGTYNAAYAAARSQAMVELSAMLKTEIAAAMEDKVDNAGSTSVSSVTIEKFHERAKSIVDQCLTNSIPVLTISRVLSNGNFEVMVRIAYDKKELAARLKRQMQNQLEKEGDELNGLVDKVLSDGM